MEIQDFDHYDTLVSNVNASAGVCSFDVRSAFKVKGGVKRRVWSLSGNSGGAENLIHLGGDWASFTDQKIPHSGMKGTGGLVGGRFSLLEFLRLNFDKSRNYSREEEGPDN